MIDGRTNTVMVAKYKPIRQGIMLTVRAIIATHQGVAVKRGMALLPVSLIKHLPQKNQHMNKQQQNCPSRMKLNPDY